MFKLIQLITLEELMAEGHIMYSALKLESFSQALLDAGTAIYTLRTSSRDESVANITVDEGIVTNIVGPCNRHISVELLHVLRARVSGIATIREGHTHGHMPVAL